MLSKIAVLAVAALAVAPPGLQESVAQTVPKTSEEIAFVSDRTGNSDILLTTSEGGMTVPLVAGPAQDDGPAWSPDGMQLAFASTRSGNWDLFVLDMTSRLVRQLTFDPAADFDPAWSSDGRIAYESFDGTQRKIRVVPAAGGRPRRVTSERGVELDPTFLGDEIVFTRTLDGSSELWKTKVGGVLRRRTAEGSGDSHAAVTPNGKRIAFERPANEATDDLFQTRALVRRKAREITETRADEAEPSWAPDNERLAFMTTRDGDYEIYVRDTGTGDTSSVTRHPEAQDTNPAWRPTAPPVVPRSGLLAIAAGGVACPRPGSPLNFTERGDRIPGGPLGETFCGGGGNDKLFGRGGNDKMCGDAGRDVLRGGPGDDTLLSGGACGLGRDRLRGGRANDLLYGDGDGKRDCVWGGPGNDRGLLDQKDNRGAGGCGNSRSIEAFK